jgi:hypothetical protein
MKHLQNIGDTLMLTDVRDSSFEIEKDHAIEIYLRKRGMYNQPLASVKLLSFEFQENTQEYLNIYLIRNTNKHFIKKIKLNEKFEKLSKDFEDVEIKYTLNMKANLVVHISKPDMVEVSRVRLHSSYRK